MRAASAACVLIAWAAASAQVHPSPMAGRWFPADAAALSQALDSSFAASARRVPGPARPRLLGLVAPHAGIQYSGTVAASAYRLLGDPPNIIVLGFSHRTPMQGIAAPNVDAFSTPLGEVKVNRDALLALGFPMLEEKRLCDHSLENQLPFLQRSAPRSKLIPLYVGALGKAELEAVAKKLAQRVAQGDAIVASSDFTHHGESYGYTPFPNDARLPERLRQRASDAFEHIGSLHVPLFDRFLKETGDTICGRDPVRLLMAAMAAAGSDVYLSTADYMTSGEILGDHSASVGYAALAFYPSAAFSVSPEARRSLLSHSRASLQAMLDGAQPPPLQSAGELSQRTGVFVTIKRKGELRGCIGVLSPRETLPASVADRTLAAARSDPRFPPLTAADGPVSLELSLLTPMKLLPEWRAFREGLGAVLVHGNRGGLLLPQVAAEMGWNRERFLEGLSQKAGLPPGAYRDPKAKLYVFGAQVFAEP